MARVLPGPPPGSLLERLPKGLDNDPQDPNPLKFTLRAPSNHERRELEHHPMKPGDVEKDEKGNLTPAYIAKYSAWVKKLVREFLVEVSGYVARGGKVIKTVDDLFALGEWEVIEEAHIEILKLLYLAEAEGKPSAAPSDLSSSAMRPWDGTAVSAEPPATTSPATAASSGQTQASSTSPPAA